MIGSAVFDLTGAYRYLLTRRWLPFAPPAVFVMLNPSTAPAETDDPTVRRAIAFAQAWGFGGLDVLNLFAYRSTDPHSLETVSDPVGPENNRYLEEVTAKADRIVVAWGEGGRLHDRETAVLTLLKDRSLHCLGRTHAGHPRHPLYVAADTSPISFVPTTEGASA
jgi:hypothetical protein